MIYDYTFKNVIRCDEKLELSERKRRNDKPNSSL